MTITPQLFEAFLKCPTKCWLRAAGEQGAGNAYAEWVESQTESYRAAEVERLRSTAAPGEFVTSPPADGLKEAKWKLALDVLVKTADLESRVHALERVPSEGRGRPAQFIPVRFIFRNKLTKDDKLLVAFDALVLSGLLQREVAIGRIIHGDNRATLKVKISGLTGQVRKVIQKITALLSSSSPPDLILNRHCPECEFRDRCRQKAIEKDDLSLLAGLSMEKRKEYNQKGIFTVTQLSYTFRPRRRPKHLRDKRERYHHSLKALAIREKKVYVVGSSAFKVEGTPVYLDVESVPDRDFYYLIGARVKTAEGFVQHSFWADDIADEPRIWRDFLALMARVATPCLIHYGSFEKTFLKQMSERHGGPPGEATGVLQALEHPVNLVSAIFAQVYFPTSSNSLKEVAAFLGFHWSEPDASGLLSVAWRDAWNRSKAAELKERLVRYNAEDCEALVLVEGTIKRLGPPQDQTEKTERQAPEVIRTDDLRHPLVNKWNVFKSPLPDLEAVTNAAHWDYQRDRIYVRTSKRIRTRARRTPNHDPIWRVDKVVAIDNSTTCPCCHAKCIRKGVTRSRTVQEMLFARGALKRRVIRYDYQPYWCPICRRTFGIDKGVLRRGRKSIYGRSLIAYFLYHVIDLYIPMQVVAKSLNRLFGLNLSTCSCKWFKAQSAEYYAETQRQILRRIIGGTLVHADETHFRVLGKLAYVWVFTNTHLEHRSFLSRRQKSGPCGILPST
jgi:predicted RecB family nuclease